MKKFLMIAGTVAALLLAVILADRATRHSVPHAAFLDSPGAGSPAPEFRLKDLKGQDVSLSQHRGKVVLVNFWATWCTPCRIEIPWLIELQEKYSSRGFTVLGVAMDEDGKKAVDRKSTRLNSSHGYISYAVFCLKKKKKKIET